jgi:2-methylcitrate dehydratase PrpD
MGATRDIAEWASSLRYEDIPQRLHERTKAQFLSVLAAVHAARYSEGARAAREVTRSWGGPAESMVYGPGERMPHLSAIFANACASVSFDFDDYLFAGHTGHSAVLVALAYGELTGASGRDVLTAATVANEVGGRLGAALLFGPQNGQMWAYIHLLESACAAGRLLGLDADRMANAIGIAFAQPVYPLVPAFMGPDSKMLLPASTSVEGSRAAELARAGWTGAPAILEDRQGFLSKFNEQNLSWMLTGLGRAWVSDSLTYKVVPGCAYIDTAVDAMEDIRAQFERERGRALAGEDVQDVHVRCGLYTMGMETLSSRYKSEERLQPITINFSVALSFGLMLEAGSLAPQYLSHAWLDAHREPVESVAARVRIEHDPQLDAGAAAAGESRGFSLRSLLSARGSLDEVSFEGYTMAFPSEVTLATTDGGRYQAAQDVPLGAAGRDWSETSELVRRKFTGCFDGGDRAAKAALAAIEDLENVSDVRELTPVLAV